MIGAAIILLTAVSGPCDREWSIILERRLLSLADTVALADSLRRSNTSCARDVGTYLLAFIARRREDLWRQRVEVETQLKHVYRRNPNNPRVFIAYAALKYAQGIRVDALRLLKRAADRAPRANPALTAHERAVVEYLQGRIHQDWWRDWRDYGYLLPTSQGQFNCEPKEYPPPGSLVGLNIACPELFEELMDTFFRSNADLKGESREALEAHYRTALDLDPLYWPAIDALASEFVYERNWTDLEALARSARDRDPTDWRPWAYLGLIAHERGVDSQAVAPFDSARARMSLEILVVYEDLDRLLTIPEQRAFAQQPMAVRERLQEAYWRSREALFLTDEHERRLEHWSRVTAAGLLFREPETGTLGWDTDAGDVWIRYGRPLKMRALAVTNGRGSFWSYGPDPDFVFVHFLTYAPLHTHGEALHWAHRQLQEEPTRYQPVFTDSVIDLQRQIVRFRGTNGRGELLVLARYPDVPRAALETGVTALNDGFATVAQWKGPADRDLPGMSVTLRGLRPGIHYLAVEAFSRSDRVLARSRDTLTVVSADSLTMSDLLIARAVEGPDNANRRRDLRFDYVYGLAIEPGEPVALYWEVYGLAADTNGQVGYDVEVELWNAQDRPFLGRILRAVGRGFRSERPTTRLVYSKSGLARGGIALEWLTLSGEWSEGRYRLQVRIHDRVSNMSYSTSRVIQVQ